MGDKIYASSCQVKVKRGFAVWDVAVRFGLVECRLEWGGVKMMISGNEYHLLQESLTKEVFLVPMINFARLNHGSTIFFTKDEKYSNEKL